MLSYSPPSSAFFAVQRNTRRSETRATVRKGGNKLLSIPTSGDNKANSNVPDVSSCPEEKPDTPDTLCSIEGQLCIFTIDTTFPGGSSTAMDECTCTTGKWICEAIMASSDIAMNACPAESTLVTNDTICDTEYSTPCSFEYTTTESSAICTNKDDCMCNGGKWACYPSTSCITTDTSNVVDSCPEDSPFRMDADVPCDEEAQLCTYTKNTIFPGGSSNAREECTCTSGKWFCQGTAASGLEVRICPSESPLVSQNMTCDEADGGLPTPCTFKYKTSSPEAICTHKDECTCNSGQWECYIAVGCVTANPSDVDGVIP